MNDKTESLYISHPRRAMTWRELRDFLNERLPECNLDEPVLAWNGGAGEHECMGPGQTAPCHGISPFDAAEPVGANAAYAIDFNGGEAWG